MRLLPLVIAVLLAGCAPQAVRESAPAEVSLAPARPSQEGPTPKGQRDLATLASFFTGVWDSKPGEPPMRFRVAEFWKGSAVRWFYLEWVRPSDESRPTRQLVLRVAEDGDSVMTATLHRLPGDAARFAGEWKKAEPFASLKPADLPAAEPCRLKTMRTLAAHFTLVTEGNRCPGDLPGAPFMRFEFSLASSELALLEQPRDAAGHVPPKSRLEPFQFGRSAREPRG